MSVIDNILKTDDTKLNESLRLLYDTNFKPIIEEAKLKIKTHYIDKSNILEKIYKPKNIIYTYPCNYHLNNKNILSMINICKAENFTDFIINYKFYFYIILDHAITKNNSMKTISNYIKYFTVLFRDLTAHDYIDEENKITIINIHTYFKNLLSTFNEYIIIFKEQENKLNETEKINFVKYEEVLQIYNNLKNESLDQNIKKVILALYVLEAPARLEMLNTKFILNINDNDLKEDYIFLDKENNNVEIIFNKRKKNKGNIKYTVKNQELKELLFDSYNRYPRLNVICSITDKDKVIKPCQKINYLKYINPKFCVNMLRSSYYSYHTPLYKDYNDMNADAFKSRTSTTTIMKHYYKKL